MCSMLFFNERISVNSKVCSPQMFGQVVEIGWQLPPLESFVMEIPPIPGMLDATMRHAAIWLILDFLICSEATLAETFTLLSTFPHCGRTPVATSAIAGPAGGVHSNSLVRFFKSTSASRRAVDVTKTPDPARRLLTHPLRFLNTRSKTRPSLNSSTFKLSSVARASISRILLRKSSGFFNQPR